MTVAIAALVTVVVLLAAGLGGAVVAARRRAAGGASGGAPPRATNSARAGGLGRELFARQVRLDEVAKQARREALVDLSDAAIAPQVHELATSLEAACVREVERLHAAAPLTGPAREHALALVDPSVAELERAGVSVVELARRVSEGDLSRAGSQPAQTLSRQIAAMSGALDELQEVDAATAAVEAALREPS